MSLHMKIAFDKSWCFQKKVTIICTQKPYNEAKLKKLGMLDWKRLIPGELDLFLINNF